MTADERREFAELKAERDELKAQHDRLVKILADVGDYAGVDIVNSVSPPEPMGQVLPWRGASKRVAGSAVPQTAPRRASTPGVAS